MFTLKNKADKVPSLFDEAADKIDCTFECMGTSITINFDVT